MQGLFMLSTCPGVSNKKKEERYLPIPHITSEALKYLFEHREELSLWERVLKGFRSVSGYLP